MASPVGGDAGCGHQCPVVPSAGTGLDGGGERDGHAAAAVTGLGGAELLGLRGELVHGTDEGLDVGVGREGGGEP